MKKLIVLVLLLSSMHSRANETESPIINCWDGLYVGKTSVEVAVNEFAIHIEDHPFSDEDLSELVGAGYTQTFYTSKNIVILDLYENSEKVGTLIAVHSGWGRSRLEYKGKNLGFGLNCSIRGN